MAYRVVRQEMWNDEKVVDFYSVEDKYFWLFLLTNPQCNALGIYKLPIKIAAFQLGYSIEQVRNLLDRFIKHHNGIRYNFTTQEVAIGNYLYHSIITGGTPILNAMMKDIEGISDTSLFNFVLDKLSRKEITNMTVLKVMERLKEKSSKKENNVNGNGMVWYGDTRGESAIESDTFNYTKPLKHPAKSKTFIKPTLDKIKSYCIERDNQVNANKFFDFYESKGWLVGKTGMKDWKAAVRCWEANNYEKNKGGEKDEYDDYIPCRPNACL